MEANETILEMKYARIIKAMADMRNITLEEAMDIFYNSQTFNLINDGVADLHCRSDLYLAEEILMEYDEKHGQLHVDN
ncbi:MAG: DUF3791 domain-containing protein [Salinivirgaceae bacterium]|nr:DUF3791 domain-containing protein [Salinivirgaceae bacterium]MBR6083481.1 DUF3791 domain-containing protein [Salinivirgaceae bacterium]